MERDQAQVGLKTRLREREQGKGRDKAPEVTGQEVLTSEVEGTVEKPKIQTHLVTC